MLIHDIKDKRHVRLSSLDSGKGCEMIVVEMVVADICGGNDDDGDNGGGGGGGESGVEIVVVVNVAL